VLLPPLRPAWSCLSALQTDEVKGTGVWRSFQLERDDDEEKDEKTKKDASTK